ncbi:hypothetical protein [Pleionea mediterranea]|nr:hypothetical protein [Pleionea mediterranea]
MKLASVTTKAYAIDIVTETVATGAVISIEISLSKTHCFVWQHEAH